MATLLFMNQDIMINVGTRRADAYGSPLILQNLLFGYVIIADGKARN